MAPQDSSRVKRRSVLLRSKHKVSADPAPPKVGRATPRMIDHGHPKVRQSSVADLINRFQNRIRTIYPNLQCKVALLSSRVSDTIKLLRVVSHRNTFVEVHICQADTENAAIFDCRIKCLTARHFKDG